MADGEGSTGSGSLPRALPPPLAAGLVFVAAGAVLMLEILAVRLLAPYVGLTLETTTAIIGAALGGIAVGTALGGYFADRTDTRLLIVGLLIAGGLLTLLTVPIVRWLGPGARGDGDFAALAITLLALVPAAAVLSAVSPAVAHLQLHDLRASGTIVGRLSGWGTAGALVGTFGTGFVLVPLLPVGLTVLLIGVVLTVGGIVLGIASRLLPPAVAAGVALAALLLSGLSATSDSPCDTETRYHCVSLVADQARPASYNLMLDDGLHSYVDLRDPTYLEYAYTRWIADSIDATNPPRKPLDALFVGGGGFTLPRWLLATRPGSHAQVVEVDGELVDFVEERLGLRASPALRVSVGDARIEILDVADDSVDVVVGDAFSATSVPWHLTTAEWTEEVRRVLEPGGLYAMNVIDFRPIELASAEAATLRDTFSSVRFVSHEGITGGLFGGNLVFLASDQPLPYATGSSAKLGITYDDKAVEALADGAEVLRDDFAPADQLLTARP
ncbi:MAG TPA: fused MFS/spermidine synthase [Solirubrobacterales bacterium]|nr:fused MFS/spermidine synthase [Solirubrobacterales bacterium]